MSAVLNFVVFIAVFVALLFVPAGRWDLWAFWAYIGVFVVTSLIAFVVVMKTDPTLIQERRRPGPGGKDPHMRWIVLVIYVVHLVVAGLDVGRYHWSSEMPASVHAFGLAAIAAAMGISTWAMGVNRFYSSDARIQRERGHVVVTDGPYRYVRHPGYACAMLMLLASPLALGSYWSSLPLLVAIGPTLRRLRIEEKLLHEELEGYAEYAQRVRYRLVPGLW